MNRIVRTLLVVTALACALPASAQLYEDGAFVDDGSSGASPRARRRQNDGPGTLQEAQASGRGLVIGGGTYRRAVPETYTVHRGDTLWDVTGHYYGNPWEWPRVWSYNPEITNPHWIYPLDTIRLLPAGQMQVSLPTRQVGPRVVSAARRRDPGSVFLREEGFLEQEEVRASGVIVGSPEGHMLLSPFDEVYVRFDDPNAVQVGREYTIFHEFDVAARGNDEQGTLVRIFGAVRVTSWDRDRNMARGVITEALDPIERGYRVAPMDRRFEDVAPRRNAQDVRGSVVAALRPTRLQGDQQIIFLDFGAEQGIESGNRAFIVRRGDEWRDQITRTPVDMGSTVDSTGNDDRYPDEVVAEARIVLVRRHTAVALVTRATREITIGDRAEVRQGY